MIISPKYLAKGFKHYGDKKKKKGENRKQPYDLLVME
jgi:hypothetical protein